MRNRTWSNDPSFKPECSTFIKFVQLPLPKIGHITGKMPKSVKMTDFLNSDNRDVLYIKRTALIYRRRWLG